jgi:ABC-type phosphate/phosphonate transport system substrate-binding protein
MALRKLLCQRGPGAVGFLVVVAALLASSWAVQSGQQSGGDLLRIGTSGTLSVQSADRKERSAVETLQSFIRDETGLSNEIVRQRDWRELADKLAKGQLQLGVFQGYEFAWAQGEHPGLRPLALAVNIYRYPVAYVVARHDSPARDFAGLQGQTVAIPATGQRFLRLFVERQTQLLGKDSESFFAKITSSENIEDALDDVVDGVVQAAVLDRAALEAYRQRKPGRFKQLKEVARSQPFPPPLVAYSDKAHDEATLRRFRDGLVNAGRKERGQTMLTLFHLTGFEAVPEDFARVLAETRRAYPLPARTK